MNFEKWFDKNCDKLEEKYSEYIKEIDTSIKRYISFNEFALGEFESLRDDFEDESYERHKEERFDK